MAEVAHALALLRQEISIAEEVLGVLNKCPSGTKLDTNGRGAMKKALLVLKGKELKLASAGDALAQHQRLHLEVEALRAEVRAGEKQVQECANRLTRAEATLSGPLKAAKQLLEAGRKAEGGEIYVADVVDYAQRISGMTSAPSYWKPGMAMVGFAPPAPRPEMMRAGALSAFAVTTGTSLSAEKLLKIAEGLDKPPDKAALDDTNGRSSDSTSDDNSSSEILPNGTKKAGDGKRDEDGKSRKTKEAEAKRTAAGKAGASSNSVGGLSGIFSRDSAPEKPKISLDISDDSDSDEDDDSD